MSWFVDASAIVAIVEKDNDWGDSADRLQGHSMRLWSPMSRWESVAGLRARLETTADIAQMQVMAFGRECGFVLVPIGEAEADLALASYQQFGKDSQHPAHLDMGDCFAYACAKTHGAKLLYKGNDFIHTDIG